MNKFFSQRKIILFHIAPEPGFASGKGPLRGMLEAATNWIQTYTKPFNLSSFIIII